MRGNKEASMCCLLAEIAVACVEANIHRYNEIMAILVESHPSVRKFGYDIGRHCHSREALLKKAKSDDEVGHYLKWAFANRS